MKRASPTPNSDQFGKGLDWYSSPKKPEWLFGFLQGEDRAKFAAQERRLRRPWYKPWLLPRYPTEREAARALLIEADALLLDLQGRVSLGPGTPQDAYLRGASLFFHGELKIEKWEGKRSEFRRMISEQYETLKRQIDEEALKSIAALTPRYATRSGPLARWPGLFNRVWATRARPTQRSGQSEQVGS